MKHRIFISVALLSVSACMIDGCSLPQCHEGEVVCVDSQNDQFDILQSSLCDSDECLNVTNDQACQLYRCSNDNYLPVAHGNCSLGSRIENGSLSCIPRCNEGEIVCAVGDASEQLDIKHSSMDEEGSVNDVECQLYRCSNDNYMPVNNGSCLQGSRVENGILSCIPKCNEGETVCAVRDEHSGQLEIKQTDSETEGAVYAESCQKYRCTKNEYVFITDCTLGSRIEEGVLNCIPQCNEGEFVCAIRNEQEQLEILQKDSDEEASVNENACQKYKCAKNEYVPVANGYCNRGSKIEAGVLNCIPQCDEGEIICGVADENGEIDILQWDSDIEGFVNEQPCQKYKCSKDQYVAIANGNCESGSRISNGGLECRNRCETVPASRCKNNAITGLASVQTCSNDGSNMWVDDFSCDESCRFDAIGEFASYLDDGYQAGTCGNCRINMQPYCERSDDSDKKRWVNCIDGVLNKDSECPYRDAELTECGVNKYVNTSVDPTNCGECGNTCLGSQTCIGGNCSTLECIDGYMTFPFDGVQIRAYCIETEDDLRKMSDYLNGSGSIEANDIIRQNTDNAYIIMEDITYSEEWHYPGNASKPVDGITIIGQGHRITFTHEIVGNEYIGMFGYLTNSTLDSLDIRVDVENRASLDSNEIELNQATGGFAGVMENVIVRDCHLVEGSLISGGVNLGGIAGKAIDTTISKSGTSGTIATTAHDGHLEALLDKHPTTEVSTNMGGLVGTLENSTIYSSNSGMVLMGNKNYPVSSVGGIVGIARGTNTISSCAGKSSIERITGHSIGGLVGKAELQNTDSVLTIESSEFNGKINLNIKMTDIEGVQDSANLFRNNPDILFPSEAIGGLIGETIGYGMVRLNFNHVKAVINAHGQAGGYIGRLATAAEIEGCIEYQPGTNKCKTYSKNNDINITAYRYAGGLIGVSTANTTIKNIRQTTVVNSSKNVFCYDGCLYHDNINYSYYLPDIHFSSYGAGGVIGAALSGNLNINNLQASSTVSIAYDGGGLIGYNAAISNLSKVELRVANKVFTHSGGFIGSSHSIITSISDSTFKNLSSEPGLKIFDDCVSTYMHPDCRVQVGCENPYSIIQSNSGDYVFCGKDEINARENYDYELTLISGMDPGRCSSYCVKPKTQKTMGGAIGESKDKIVQIDGLKIQLYARDIDGYVGGVFGFADNYYSMLSNLDMNQVRLIHNTTSGAVSGYAKGTAEISKILIRNSTVTAMMSAGGLIGEVNDYDLKMNDSVLMEEISSYWHAGGLIGSGNGLSFDIRRILTNSRIDGLDGVGGLVGDIVNEDQSGTLIDSGILGTVSCSGTGNCGGLFGSIIGIYNFNSDDNTGYLPLFYTLINIAASKNNRNVGLVAGSMVLRHDFLLKTVMFLTKKQTYRVLYEHYQQNEYEYPQSEMPYFGPGSTISGRPADQCHFETLMSADLQKESEFNAIFPLPPELEAECVIFVKGNKLENDRCVRIRYHKSIDNVMKTICVQDISVCPKLTK